mgnify:CR=1 FL=1
MRVGRYGNIRTSECERSPSCQDQVRTIDPALLIVPTSRKSGEISYHLTQPRFLGGRDHRCYNRLIVDGVIDKLCFCAGRKVIVDRPDCIVIRRMPDKSRSLVKLVVNSVG